MRKLKWIAGILIVLAVAVYFGLSYFQSHYLKSEILPKVLESLEEKAQVRVGLGEMEISLLRGVVIRQLNAQLNQDGKDINVQADGFRISYSLWSLFSKDFRISDFTIDEVNVSAKLVDSGVPPPQGPPLSETMRGVWRSIEALPLGVQISQVDLKKINLKLEWVSSKLAAQVNLKDIQIQAAMAVKSDLLKVGVKFEVPDGAGQFVQAKLDHRIFSIQPATSFELEMAAEKANGWKLHVDELEWTSQSKAMVEDVAVSNLYLKIGSLDKAAFEVQLDSEVLESLFSKLDLPQDLAALKNFKNTTKVEINLGLSVDELVNNVLQDQLPENIEVRVVSKSSSLAHQALKLESPEVTANARISWGGKAPAVVAGFKFSSPQILTGYEESSPLELFQNGIEVVGAFGFSEKSVINIQALKVANNLSAKAPTLLSQLSGSIQPRAKSLNLSGSVELRSGDGFVRIPWNFQRTQRNRLRLEGEIVAKDFSVRSSHLKLTNLQSQVPMRFDVIWKGERSFELAEVITRNPFERVDYASIRPYVTTNETNLRFDSLELKDYKVGPLFADVHIRQNLVMVEQYQLDLLGGRANGLAFTDLRPDAPRLGFLSRVSGLNPKLLTEKQASEADKRISSRLAMVYDFQRSNLEGRFDITEIGGPQLIALIKVLDPTYQNSKLNLARSALKIAAPQYVGLKMYQGALDLRIDLGGLVQVSDISVDNIPLSPLLAMARDSVLDQLSLKEKGVKQ